ncbi:hypothetical protein C8R43DRAFT_1120390 [Mycena crocata]|nr:hypothetical protein C8R43DRAFT_1120390 [Mycena crocata]
MLRQPEPCLSEEDYKLISHAPIQAEFNKHHAHDRSLAWKNELIKELLADDAWCQCMFEWLHHCITLNMERKKGATLFVEVLWLQHQRLHDEAYQTLLRGQIVAYKDLCGPELNVFATHGGFASEEDWTESTVNVEPLIAAGAQSKPNLGSVVKSLQDMRKVLEKVYQQALFREAVKDSQLAATLEIINNIHTQRELTIPHILLSDAQYHWCSFLGDILYNWTPGHVKHSGFVAPADSDFLIIEHRPDVLKDCKRDEVIFKDKATSDLVGGVKFKPWTQELLGEL